MDRDTSLIYQRLVEQWDEVKTALERMNAAATVLPADGWCIFHSIASNIQNVVEFEVKPVVFNLPERASSVNTDLFVVVQGRLAFRRDLYANDHVLATHSFSTKAAYFRWTENRSAHVYGAHYEFVLDEVGHPIFHSQMRNFPELWTYVVQQFEIEIAGVVDDRVVGVLRNVRLPSAQMDLFSFVLQVCADHLLFAQSGTDERAAFNKLLEKNRFLKGAGFQAGRLTTDAARSCYRARHWYPLLS